MNGQTLIDSHAHLEMKHFRGDLERVLERAHAAGVTHVVTVGSTIADSRRAVKIAEKYQEVSAVVGVHPHDATEADDWALEELGKLAAKNVVVGIGETGLDFFRDRSPRDLQEDSFRKHIDLAKETDLPLVVHVRDAYLRALQILQEEGLPERGGVVHCFSGTLKDAEAFLDLGMYLSFTGTVTFPSRRNTEWVEKILPDVPLEKMMVETDCPYLAPHPYRGQRNEPAYVELVSERIAQIKGLSRDDIARVTTRNAVRFFNLPVTLSKPRAAYTIRDSAYVNVTDSCTSACTFCQRNANPVVKGHDLTLATDPSVPEMISALEEEGWEERSEVVFCGYGEPTIRLEEIKEVAESLRRRDVRRIRLNTNGLGNLYHNRDIVGELKGFVDVVSVSLNTHNAETFLRLCRPTFGEGSYEAMLDFSRSCKLAGMKVILTVVDHPEVDIDQCRAIAEQMGAGFRVRPYNEVG
jgi:TatD DNase family protein